MKIAGMEIKGGKIVQLDVESISTAPSFSASDVGKFFFSSDDGLLRFNNGSNLYSLNTTVSENPNLINSLGSNWLNEDLTFNPTPFNDLPVLDGLTTNDDLFTVIEQIVTSLSTVTDTKFADIDFSEVVASDFSVMVIRGGVASFVSLETVFSNSEVIIQLDDISGLNITSKEYGNMLSYDEQYDLISRPVAFEYTNYVQNTSFNVNHGLNKRYCQVTCINPATHEMIQPASIVYDTANSLTINFDTATGVVALITNLQATNNT